MTLKRITLRLARNPGITTGDDTKGYVLTAPLTPSGALDLEAWRAQRKACTAVRFDPDPDERADGWLTHRGSHWYIRYDEDHEGEDEPAHRLGDHLFVTGEYITIRHHGEEALTYRISDISNA